MPEINESTVRPGYRHILLDLQPGVARKEQTDHLISISISQPAYIHCVRQVAAFSPAHITQDALHDFDTSYPNI